MKKLAIIPYGATKPPFRKGSTNYDSCVRKLCAQFVNLIKKGYTDIYSALTCPLEIWYLELLLELRAAHPIKINVIEQNAGRENFPTSVAQIYAYHDVLEACNRLIMFDKAGVSYRNEFVIDHADTVLALCSGETEVRSSIHDYVKKNKKEIIFYDVKDLTTNDRVQKNTPARKPVKKTVNPSTRKLSYENKNLTLMRTVLHNRMITLPSSILKCIENREGESLCYLYSSQWNKLYFTFEAKPGWTRLNVEFDAEKKPRFSVPLTVAESMGLERKDSVVFCYNGSPVFSMQKAWFPNGCACCGADDDLIDIERSKRPFRLCRKCFAAVVSTRG